MEDEFHFVCVCFIFIECPIYEKDRLNFLEYIEEHFKNLAELQAFDKFIWLMSQTKRNTASITEQMSYSQVKTLSIVHCVQKSSECEFVVIRYGFIVQFC